MKVSENAEDIPARIGYVNDYANMFSATTKDKLETNLTGLKARRNVELVIVCVNSTGGRKLEDYSLEVVNKWNLHPANEKKIITIIVKDDNSYRTMVSDGLSEEVPNEVLSDLQDVMQQPFSEEKFDEGIEIFVEKMTARIDEQENLLKLKHKKEK